MVRHSYFRELLSFILRNLQIEPASPLRHEVFQPRVTGFIRSQTTMGLLTPAYFIALFRSMCRLSNVPKPLSFCEALRPLPYAVGDEYALNHSCRILSRIISYPGIDTEQRTISIHPIYHFSMMATYDAA